MSYTADEFDAITADMREMLDHTGTIHEPADDPEYWEGLLTDPEQNDTNIGGHTASEVFRDLPAVYEPEPLEWLVRGLITSETHGEIGGAQKSLKTYVALTIAVGVALGKPVLGRFVVPERKRVLLFAGEGGERMLLARLHRICAAYGAEWPDLAGWLRYTTVTAPITSPAFAECIRTECEAFDPALVDVDPWYVYAGADMSASQLTEVGDRLEQVRRAVGPKRALFINHHLNSTGTGSGIVRLSGAGHAEWVDSWLLLNHRTPPDVNQGRFRLTLEVGSRQWGGSRWDVDFDIGHFDTELGQHDGPIRWTCVPATSGSDDKDADTEIVKAAEARRQLVSAWNARRGTTRHTPLTRTEWVAHVRGVRRETVGAAWRDMLDAGHIVHTGGTIGTRKAKYVYRANPDDLPETGEETDPDELGF